MKASKWCVGTFSVHYKWFLASPFFSLLLSLQFLHVRLMSRRHWKETREEVKNKSENCVLRVTQRGDLCTHLFLGKGSANFLNTRLRGSHWMCLATPSYCRSIFFFSIISCSFPAAFPVRPRHWPGTCVWSLSWSAPWKPRASWQKCTSAHTRPYSLQKGHSIWISLFFHAAPLRHGKAQDWLCVAETTAFYRLGGQEWLNG